jgi:hypothetical protein
VRGITSVVNTIDNVKSQLFDVGDLVTNVSSASCRSPREPHGKSRYTCQDYAMRIPVIAYAVLAGCRQDPPAPPRDIAPPEMCFRGETTWTYAGRPEERAPAYLWMTLDRAASMVRAQWVWLNPADPSHPVMVRDERWRVEGKRFVIQIERYPESEGYTGEFLAGDAWKWTEWRTQVNDGRIDSMQTFTRKDNRLRSSGHKTTGKPGDAYYLHEEQRDELAQIECSVLEQDLKTADQQPASP